MSVDESLRTGRLSMRRFHTLVDGNRAHGAGLAVGAAVGLAVGFAVGLAVGAVVGFVMGATVGATVGPDVLPGLAEERGPLVELSVELGWFAPEVPETLTGTARSSFQTLEPGMAVGPTAARVVEPAIDECGPPFTAPVGAPPNPAQVVSRITATPASASRRLARGDRRSIPAASATDRSLSMAKSSGGPPLFARETN